MRSALCILLLCTLVVGCSRKNPVNEVSVADSNVSIDESVSIPMDGWPQWRGPHGNGIADNQTVPTNWDETTNVKWKKHVPGRGHGSPMIVEGMVVVASAQDKERQTVTAYAISDGEVRWTKEIHQGNFPADRDVHSKATNANGTLASDGERIFAAFLNGGAIIATALDFQGEILWQKEIGKFVSKFGYAPSPVLYKSTVIFAADNHGGGYLASLDGRSGEILWRVSRGNASSYSSPHVANLAGKDQILISGGDALVSYDPQTGDENWRTACIAESTCGTVVTSGDKLFASGGYPDKQTICLNAEGKELWSNQTKIYEPSMLATKSRLYGITDDGIAYCWSTEDGEVLWKKRLGGNFSASPIRCGDKIYVPNLNGKTFVFRDSDEFDLIATNELGSDSYASPAAAENNLLMRIGFGQGNQRKEYLVCIALPESAE